MKSRKLRMMNKKGLVFNMFLVLMTFLVLLDAYIVLSSAFAINDGKGPTETIGKRQLDLMAAYSGASKVNIYTDKVAEISFNKALIDSQKFGGIISPEDSCGEYFGFTKWRDEVDKRDCIPKQKDVEQVIKELFTAEFKRRLFEDPSISKRSFAELVEVDGNELQGLVQIPQSNKLRCTPSLIRSGNCKMYKEAIPHLLDAVELLDSDEYFMVTSGYRPWKKQASLVENNLKNAGASACGTSAVVTKFNLKTNIGTVPRKTSSMTSEEYNALRKAYLKKSVPYFETHPEISSFIRNQDYSICPHPSGKAVDIHVCTFDSGCGSSSQLKKGKIIYNSAGESIYDRARMIMCQAGWVNFAGERWHFEYGTYQWGQRKPYGLEASDVGNPSEGTYNSACSYRKGTTLRCCG